MTDDTTRAQIRADMEDIIREAKRRNARAWIWMAIALAAGAVMVSLPQAILP